MVNPSSSHWGRFLIPYELLNKAFTETYAEFLGNLRDRRNVEMDAMSMDAQKEKIYTDEDMWLNI